MIVRINGIPLALGRLYFGDVVRRRGHHERRAVPDTTDERDLPAEKDAQLSCQRQPDAGAAEARRTGGVGLLVLAEEAIMRILGNVDASGGCSSFPC
jgi:hypothetical protein